MALTNALTLFIAEESPIIHANGDTTGQTFKVNLFPFPLILYFLINELQGHERAAQPNGPAG